MSFQKVGNNLHLFLGAFQLKLANELSDLIFIDIKLRCCHALDEQRLTESQVMTERTSSDDFIVIVPVSVSIYVVPNVNVSRANGFAALDLIGLRQGGKR